MSYFSFINKEQSEAWVNGFPQLARAGLTSGLTAHGESIRLGLLGLKQGHEQGLKHLGLCLVVSALILGGASIIGVYLGSGAPTCAAVGV